MNMAKFPEFNKRTNPGDFDQYSSTEEILKNGWKMIKPQNYDFALIDVMQSEMESSKKAKDEDNKKNADEERRLLATDKVIGKAITLTKKSEDVIINKPFDDGLYFQFKKSKPKHISFECKTSNAETSEACDVRLFLTDSKKSKYAKDDANNMI